MDSFWEMHCWFGKEGDVRKIAFDTLWRRGMACRLRHGECFWRLRGGFGVRIECVEAEFVSAWLREGVVTLEVCNVYIDLFACVTRNWRLRWRSIECLLAFPGVNPEHAFPISGPWTMGTSKRARAAFNVCSPIVNWRIHT